MRCCACLPRDRIFRARRLDDHAGALAMRDSSHERAALRVHVHSMIPMHDSDSFWMGKGITRAPA